MTGFGLGFAAVAAAYEVARVGAGVDAGALTLGVWAEGWVVGGGRGAVGSFIAFWALDAFPLPLPPAPPEGGLGSSGRDWGGGRAGTMGSGAADVIADGGMGVGSRLGGPRLPERP